MTETDDVVTSAKDLAIESAVLTHPGRKRRQNEDFVAFFEPDDPTELQQSGRLYIVADGVGGAAKGEKASQYAAQKVLFEFYHDDDPDAGARLRRSMRATGNEIYDYIENGGLPARMATTMVAANIRSGLLTIANVGDSRAYLIRDGRATQISRDHTLAGEMLKNGEINEEEAMRVKGKNKLTRSLGGERDVRIDLFRDIPIEPGDRILLCSDGLARYALSEEIAHLASSGTPEDVVRRSRDFANKRGGADNITVALIQAGEHVSVSDATWKQRGTAPVAVDWDELLTEPSIRVRPRRSRRALTREQWIIAGVAALGVLLLLTLAAMGIFGGSPDAEGLVTAPSQEELESAAEATVSAAMAETASAESMALSPELDTSTPQVPTSEILDQPNSVPFLDQNPKDLLADASSNWNLFNAQLVVLESGQQALRVTYGSPSEFEHATWTSFIGNGSFGDFYVEVTAVLRNCTGKDSSGLVVRYDSKTHETGYALESGCDGSYRLLKFLSPSFEEAQYLPPDILPVGDPSEFPPVSPESVSSRQLGFLAVGERLCLYHDRILLAERVDDEYLAGTFGLYANSLSGSSLDVDFHTMSLWQLDSDLELSGCPPEIQIDAHE